ncbi:unnamed protein product [Boreogadus saida]
MKPRSEEVFEVRKPGVEDDQMAADCMVAPSRGSQNAPRSKGHSQRPLVCPALSGCVLTADAVQKGITTIWAAHSRVLSERLEKNVSNKFRKFKSHRFIVHRDSTTSLTRLNSTHFRQHHLFNSLSFTLFRQHHLFNSLSFTLFRQHHLFNSLSFTLFRQHHLFNSLSFTLFRQHHLFNSLSFTLFRQHHLFNSLSFTLFRQHHLFNSLSTTSLTPSAPPL